MALARQQVSGVSALLTAAIGLAAGLLGSASFSYWKEQGKVEASPPRIIASKSGGTAAALRELRTLVELERQRSRDTAATAPKVSPQTPENVPEEEPALSHEEQVAAAVAAHRQSLDEHAREPREPGWAEEVEEVLEADIGALLEMSARVANVECRTSTCVAEIEWPSYSAALNGYTEVLHARLRTNCGKATLLPEPSEPELAYRASFVFDCGPSSVEN